MTFQLLRFYNLPIQDQLLLEEQLLKTRTENYCLINTGTPPAIVLGISGEAHNLVHLDQLPPTIPLIRRFSGGGTVIVDEETVFVTFICQKNLHPFLPYPEPILRWVASIIEPATPGLILKDNDFTLQNKKCGGNALYLKKDRWLVHTSFLWNYLPHHMQLLKHPPKTPPYRNNRPHEEFLCRLNDTLSSKEKWIDSLIASLQRSFLIHFISS